MAQREKERQSVCTTSRSRSDLGMERKGCGWVMQTVRQQGEQANDVRERTEAIGQQSRKGARRWTG
jgi:hypothetical protein